MLQLANLKVSRGDFTAYLSSLVLRQGECIALCGVSGSGKSTLLEALSLLKSGFTADRFDFAYISLQDASNSLTQAIRVASMGIMPQVGGLLPFMSLAENWRLQIQLALRQRKVLQTQLQQYAKSHQLPYPVEKILNFLCPHSSSDANELWDRLQDVIEQIGLSSYQNKLPEQLSIGQRQRAMFVRAIAHEPKLLLIDEPTSSLDPDNARLLFELMQDIAYKRKMGVIVVTHDLDLVANFRQYVYHSERSKSGLSYFGPAEDK